MGQPAGHVPELFEDSRRQTRRHWIALAASSTMLGANASAALVPDQRIQNTPPMPDQAPPAATPEVMMQKAQADVRAASDKLAGIEVPITLEPAFAFTA
ncbi:MAG TPA: hypothetical protein VHZ07_08055 [Bryobacteraceae bacterium]|nr:hypothetical protein [Bryobacteraceae bacterium]